MRDSAPTGGDVEGRVHVDRIADEFFEGFDAVADIARPAVSVFGSARASRSHPAYAAAVDIGRRFARAGFAVVTGGGPGLMEAANAGAVEGQSGKSRSFGLAIHLPTEEAANPFVDKVFRHRTFFSRLHHFIRLSSAFIVMPGGIGTALELFMVWQLLQVKHMKEHPLILVGTMWPGLIEWLQGSMLERGLVSPTDFDVVKLVGSSDDAIPIIRESHQRWLQQERENANPGTGS